ncbi:terminase large subunit [Eremococcus coleocola]|uniref:terminase large subunit n=1 Tax=Eremococcus coleocola TaxID=88132 RepID=UPI00040DF8E3|nr:terminase TerL endonuclease subunit [Eremococcus coleocola]
MSEDYLTNGIKQVKHQILTYVDESLNGTIPQGRPMKWAMERFLRDLNNSKWYFDWEEVYKFTEWCRLAKHSKGVLANQPIELHVSSLFELANILAFKNSDTGYRRFREALIFEARKQGKTQKVSLLASYIAFLSEEQEEIYIAGWDRNQSMLAYEEILFQIEHMDMLKDKYSDSYHRIKVLKNGSTIKALSREAKKTGDGTNPSVAIIDEYANAHETNEIVDVLKTGMVARKQPLMLYITTAGFNLHYPAYSYYQYCMDILNPDRDIENDSIFVAIYQKDPEDDIKDESKWGKSNPVVVTYEEGLNSLREGLKLALDRPEELRNFMTKNMNEWVDQKDNGFIDMKKYERQVMNEADVEDFLKGANMYYGIDLSSTTDLTSLGWVAVKKGQFLCGQRSYIPSEKFMERKSHDKAPFEMYKDRGEVVLTEGAVVDYEYLMNDLREMARKYGCREVGFDTWNATHLASTLTNEGFVMVDIPQGITKLTEPTKKFREQLYKQTLFHTDDKLLKWAVGNAVIITDANENIKISKKVSRDRIDPIASILNAFARAMYDDQVVDMNAVILSDNWSF